MISVHDICRCVVRGNMIFFPVPIIWYALYEIRIPLVTQYDSKRNTNVPNYADSVQNLFAELPCPVRRLIPLSVFQNDSIENNSMGMLSKSFYGIKNTKNSISFLCFRNYLALCAIPPLSQIQENFYASSR